VTTRSRTSGVPQGPLPFEGGQKPPRPQIIIGPRPFEGGQKPPRPQIIIGPRPFEGGQKPTRPQIIISTCASGECNVHARRAYEGAECDALDGIEMRA